MPAAAQHQPAVVGKPRPDRISSEPTVRLSGADLVTQLVRPAVAKHRDTQHTATVLLDGTPFVVTFDATPEEHNYYEHLPATVALESVTLWGVDIPLENIPADVRAALREGV